MSFATDHPYVLTASCPSRMGTTAAITGFLATRRFYLMEMHQFDDTISQRFFVRITFCAVAGEKVDLERLRRDGDPGVVEGVPAGAEDLRGAAQRVGILDPGVGDEVGRHHARAGQNAAHVGGRGGLAGVRSEGGQFGQEGLIGAQQSLDRHGGRHVGCRQEAGRIGAGQAQDAEHSVGAVGQRQALLGFQYQGGDAGGSQGVGGGDPLAVGVDDLALPGERQGHMREGSQVAAAAQGAVLANDRRRR